ncbi:MAG: AEC family transporter [Clostridia bacterium]|nr:AEC family transporter [Clostridia bacterium]MBR0408782.1 AEC family transporter [Clostridia bacterium]
MDDFLFALNTVLPLLLLMSLGWFCRRIGLLTEKLVTGVNQLVFKLFLPVSLCVSVMNTPYDTTISLGAFLLVVIGLAAEFGVLFLLIPRIEKDKKKIGVMIQGMARSNYAFFGIPLVAMLFPGQDTSLASLMVIATIPVYNILSVVALCVYGEGEVKLGRVLLNILKNPLIIGTAIGYVFWALRFQPPAFIKTTMSDLAKVATPLALFTLGGAIQFSSAKGHMKQLLTVVPWKLVMSPLVFLGIGVLIGVREVALACVYVAFGAPTAVASYPMAQQMGGDGELAAEIVATTSAFCILTTFLFVFALKSMGLI